MEREVELLAPAGSYESLVAAVQNGANAVYLGGTSFNARQHAENFKDEKLKEAVEYAHIRGVKVYLTLNTLLTDYELNDLDDFLIYVYSIGIDAIIVQDIGTAMFINKVIPNMNLHASTQMTIYNLEGVEQLEELNFKRVVLSRELSLEQIKYICNNTSLEIEVFIHGALCVCYSGQCLMSSLIGGRSGNRGLCAQPCRLPYTLESDKKHFSGYILSPKDLCTIYRLGEIIDSGVTSLKIEGRMKRPEYVATVVKIYNKYINKFLTNKEIKIKKEDMQDLLQIFNRGGFTEGHLLKKSDSSMMSFKKPDNWGVYIGKVQKYDKNKKQIILTLKEGLSIEDGIELWSNSEYKGLKVNMIYKNDKNIKQAYKNDTIALNVSEYVQPSTLVYKTSSVQLINNAKESYSKENKKIDMIGYVNVKKDKPMELYIVDNSQNTIQVKGNIIAQQAITKPLTYQRITEQLNKLGNTPFNFSHIEIKLDKDVSLPVSEINSIRRQAIQKLMDKITAKKLPQINAAEIKNMAHKLLNKPTSDRIITPKISVYINNLKELHNLKIEAERVYIHIKEYFKNKQSVSHFIDSQKSNNVQVFIAMPRIIKRDLVSPIKNAVTDLTEQGIDGILTTGLGQIEMFKDFNLLFASDFSYNIFNNLTIDVLQELGINSVTLSPELNLSQIENIITYSLSENEIIVYGKVPVMISEYCPIGSIVGEKLKQKCSKICSNKYNLIDRKNNKFPIITDSQTCQTQILNCKTLFLGEELQKIKHLQPDYMRLYFTTESSQEIYNTIKFHKEFLEFGKGILKDYEEYISKVKQNFTKGHYFRGVD